MPQTCKCCTKCSSSYRQPPINITCAMPQSKIVLLSVSISSSSSPKIEIIRNQISSISSFLQLWISNSYLNQVMTRPIQIFLWQILSPKPSSWMDHLFVEWCQMLWRFASSERFTLLESIKSYTIVSVWILTTSLSTAVPAMTSGWEVSFVITSTSELAYAVGDGNHQKKVTLKLEYRVWASAVPIQPLISV